MIDTFEGIIIGLLLGLFIMPFALSIYDMHFGTYYSCKYWGWHNGKGKSAGDAFDGCSFHAVCSKCGKEVMQDSQGNWF